MIRFTMRKSVSEQKDRETLEAMREYNYETILRFASDHLDSPETIVVFLKSMQNWQATNTLMLQHTNASKLQHVDYREITSYVTMLYRRSP